MVFDTNVFAFALLGVEDRCEEALEALTLAPSVWVPASFRAELLSAVWQWIRFGDLPLQVGWRALGRAENLCSHVIPVQLLWEDALFLATERGHSPYDTLFVALARRENLKVVTYDEELRAKFPAQTLSAAEVLRSG